MKNCKMFSCIFIFLVVVMFTNNSFSKSIISPKVVCACVDGYGNRYEKHQMASNGWATVIMKYYDGSEEIVMRNANFFQCIHCNIFIASQLDPRVMDGALGVYYSRYDDYFPHTTKQIVEVRPEHEYYSIDPLPNYEFLRGYLRKYGDE